MASADDTGAHARLAAAVNCWNADSTSSDVPAAFIQALRTGAPGHQYQVKIDSRQVHITITSRSNPPYNLARERAAWHELCRAVNAAITDGIQPSLPREIATAMWKHNDRDILNCRPGTAPTLRRARGNIRRRLTALSPLPLIGALIQPVAGSATAVGIAIAPIPPMHTTPPPSPVIREQNGEIDRPPLPWLAAEHPEHPSLSAAPEPVQPAPADTPAIDTAKPPASAPIRRRAAPPPAASKPTGDAPAPATTTAPDQPQPTPKASPPKRHGHGHVKHHKPRPLRGRGRR